MIPWAPTSSARVIRSRAGLDTLSTGTAPAHSAARIIPPACSQVMVLCSMSMSTKSQPACPHSSAGSMPGIRRNMPTAVPPSESASLRGLPSRMSLKATAVFLR